MAAGSAVLEVRYGWTVADGRIDALWMRIQVRGEPWAVASPAESVESVESRRLGGTQVIRIEGSGPCEFQLEGPEGQRWPPEPIRLSPPERPELTWWEL